MRLGTEEAPPGRAEQGDQVGPERGRAVGVDLGRSEDAHGPAAAGEACRLAPACSQDGEGCQGGAGDCGYGVGCRGLGDVLEVAGELGGLLARVGQEAGQGAGGRKRIGGAAPSAVASSASLLGGEQAGSEVRAVLGASPGPEAARSTPAPAGLAPARAEEVGGSPSDSPKLGQGVDRLGRLAQQHLGGGVGHDGLAEGAAEQVGGVLGDHGQPAPVLAGRLGHAEQEPGALGARA